MFISIVIEPVSMDSEKAIQKVVGEYGLKKVQKNVYESFEFPSKRLGNLKKDLTDVIDMDDKIRIYQYPLEKCFKISYIQEKKWKRLSISSEVS